MSQAHFTNDGDNQPKLEAIKDALKCEQTGHIMEAILLYEEGIFKLNQMSSSPDVKRQQLYSKHLEMYEARVRQLRDQVKEHLHDSKMLDHITIDRDARGQSYQRLLGVYLDDSVSEAHLNEPQLSAQHQFKDLINFFEVLVKNCRYLKYIRLTTRPDASAPGNQLQALQRIRDDLATGNIHMNFQLDETLHDRKIVLSSGIIIKIERGLHYFTPIEHDYSLGQCDYDFRKCLATEVDVWKCCAFAKPIRAEQERTNPYKQPRTKKNY